MRTHVDLRKLALCGAVIACAGLIFFGCGKEEEQVSAGEATPAAEPLVEAAELVVTPTVGIGDVKFGMSRQEVYDLWGLPGESRNVGYRIDYYSWLGVGLGYPFDKLGQIYCLHSADLEGLLDFAGKTAEGIRLGSSEEEVLAAYGEASGVQESGEGKVLEYAPLGASFDLRPDAQGTRRVHSMKFTPPAPKEPTEEPTEEPTAESTEEPTVQEEAGVE